MSARSLGDHSNELLAVSARSDTASGRSRRPAGRIGAMARMSLAVLAFLVAQRPCAAWARSVFIGHTCLVTSSPAAELSALGFFDSFAEFDLSGGTPTLAALQAADVALIYTNCSPADPTALGDVLADYVDAGGKLVVATYSFSSPWGIAGRITTPGYLPIINTGTNGDVSGLFSTASPSDPIFSVPNAITPAALSYFHNFNFSHPALDSGAVLLADDGFGIPLAAINAAQNVLGLNLFPEGGGFGGNNEFYRFLENSLARVKFLCNSNGVIDPDEQCDDGNAITGDGCDNACRIEPCYGCLGEPSMCTPLPDGSDCDDELFCNGTDTCASAACTIHTGDPCVGGAECQDSCNEALDVCASAAGSPCTDDGNVCTDDECDGAGNCVHPDNFFVPCDDGAFCNGDDFCLNGTCSFHNGNPCVFTECAQGCDEMNAVCIPSTAGIQCFDDGEVCTNDQCDGLGACVHPPKAIGTACTNDANTCTLDQCDGAGVCSHLPVLNGTACPADANPCTMDQCTAGFCTHPPGPNGSPCSDANACTQTDGCQAGTCVGANPVICPLPLCQAPDTCDPSSGACTRCPPGFAQGNGGCQKVYTIDATLLDNLGSICSSTNRYNDCFGAFGFHWADTGDTAIGDVTRVDIQFASGVSCDVSQHRVTLNATSIGEFASEDSCTCSPSPTTRLLTDVDTSTYAKGGVNAVSIDSSDCDGLSTDVNGDYAVVSVTYEEPASAIVIRDGCRQAMKSKFKYQNDAAGVNDKLKWKWSNGAATDQSDLADPTDATDYQLCVYGEDSGDPTLLFGAEVPPSSTLWKELGTSGYRYKDKTASQGGISKIVAKGGVDSKAKILVKGNGAALSDPTLPLAPGTSGIRVQLTNESSGVCWESEFPFGTVKVNETSIKGTVK